MIPEIVLASASPRRRALLEAAGVRFEVRPADVDETRAPDEPPEAYVRRVAARKARAIADPRPVLAADTVVALDGHVLGKPADEAEATAGLQALSGREHLVMTAVALCWRGALTERLVRTTVRFRPLAPHTIRWYLATGEPWDKAGGYGIQGHGAALVHSLDGSYSNVVGLPLDETLALLAALEG